MGRFDRPRRVTTDRIRTIDPTVISPSGLKPELLDPDALRSLRRLKSRGYEAYLVGGCVRDLLLGLRPKDFDIATAARPQQVKRTFPRNCRIIGRRFKLAHLHFDQNRKILEVATFRRTPILENGNGESESDDLLITRDNVFGTAEEDALRRDFTVNALFYDPIEDRILDYAGGLADLRERMLRTIGDPVVRFREDPVRILRAAKFAGRLGFHLDEATFEAMAEAAPDLERSAPPRVLEEILRLLRGGHALESFQILRDVGALKVILPLVGRYLAEAPQAERVVFWRLLEALDQKVARDEVPSNPVLLGALLTRPVARVAESQPNRSPTVIAEELLGPFAQSLRLPRRDAGCLKRICGVQHRFDRSNRRRFKLSVFLRDPYFAEALDLFALACVATGSGFEDLDYWRGLARSEGTPPATEGTSAGGPKHRRRRRMSARERAADPEIDAEATTPPAASSEPETLPEETAADDNGSARKRKKRSRRKRTAAQETTAGGPGPRDTSVAVDADRVGGGDCEPQKKNASKSKKKVAKPEKDRGKPGKKAKRARGTAGVETVRVGRRAKKVRTIEPEAVDVSAFDVELDPKRVPTFGALVEGQGKRRRRKPPQIDESDDYKPPPPRNPEPPLVPPPPPDDDVFGDW